MKTYGIATENIILICSKRAMAESSEFLNKMVEDKRVADFSSGNFCSAVLCGEVEKPFIKLLEKTPEKLFKQLKSGCLFLK